MDSINSLPPTRKKSLLITVILLIVALVITGFLRLTGSSETDMATFATSGAQSAEEGPQSDIPQPVAKTTIPQLGRPTNESGSLVTDAEAAGRATFVVNILQDAHTDPEQVRTTDLPSVLTASALEEFDAQALEWARDGIHTTDSPILEDVHILSDDSTGNVTVLAYIDSSGVRVLDDARTALTDDTTMTRTLAYSLFVKDDGAWKLSDFLFPDGPTY